MYSSYSGRDGHKKGYRNKVTTKSRVPTKVVGDTDGGWNTVKRQMALVASLSLEALWGKGRWALLSACGNNTLLPGSTFRVLLL